jgi:hypothetical protein
MIRNPRELEWIEGPLPPASETPEYTTAIAWCLPREGELIDLCVHLTVVRKLSVGIRAWLHQHSWRIFDLPVSNYAFIEQPEEEDGDVEETART